MFFADAECVKSGKKRNNIIAVLDPKHMIRNMFLICS